MNYYEVLINNHVTMVFFTWIISVFLLSTVFMTIPLVVKTRQIKAVLKKIEESSESVDLLSSINEMDNIVAKSVARVFEDGENGKYSLERHFNVYAILSKPSKRKLAHQIPGVLTALGILGTFIGLQMGLPSLRSATGTEVTASVQAIAMGLETAFLSSIFGIIASIVWNFLDKFFWRKSNHAFYLLCQDLANRLDHVNPANALNEIKAYQKEQTVLLKNMSAEFASQLENILVPSIKNGIQESVSSSIGQMELAMKNGIQESVSSSIGRMELAMKSGIEESLTPSIERMETVVQELSKASTENQVEAIGKIVDQFVKSMNMSLEGSFTGLQKTISDMIKWQKRTADELGYLIQVLSDAAIIQRDLNQSNAELHDAFERSFKEAKESISEIAHFLESIKELTSHMNNAYEFAKKQVDEIKDQSKKLDEKYDRYASFFEESEQVMEGFVKAIDQSNEVFESNNKSLENASTRFEESLHTGLIKSFEEFDKNMSEISRYFHGNLEDMMEASENLKGSIDHSMDGIIESVQLLNRALESIPKQIQLKIDQERTG